VAGTHADLRVSRVSVSGERSSDQIYGFNVYNAIGYQGGLAGSASPALAGLYEVRDSRFIDVAAGTPPLALKDAVVVIENNTYQGVLWAGQIGDLTNTNVKVVNNNVHVVNNEANADPGFNGYGIEVLYGFTDSRLFIARNTFKGAGRPIGINATFGGKTSCSVVLNDTPRYRTGIVLGVGTKDCLVVTTRQAGTVSDSGTNNRIITLPRR
jgi:hypothetical protein